jgi:hypothetical protein
MAVLSVPNEPLINRTKQILIKLRLFRFVAAGGGDYTVPEKMEQEWHLHEFDSELLTSVTDGIFRIKRVIGIPVSWFPLGYAALLEPL